MDTGSTTDFEKRLSGEQNNSHLGSEYYELTWAHPKIRHARGDVTSPGALTLMIRKARIVARTHCHYNSGL